MNDTEMILVTKPNTLNQLKSVAIDLLNKKCKIWLIYNPPCKDSTKRITPLPSIAREIEPRDLKNRFLTKISVKTIKKENIFAELEGKKCTITDNIKIECYSGNTQLKISKVRNWCKEVIEGKNE